MRKLLIVLSVFLLMSIAACNLSIQKEIESVVKEEEETVTKEEEETVTKEEANNYTIEYYDDIEATIPAEKTRQAV